MNKEKNRSWLAGVRRSVRKDEGSESLQADFRIYLLVGQPRRLR